METPSSRTVLLIGQAAYDKLQNSRVAVVGLGGVGGHCAEALARSGVGKLHLVDADTVNPSNLNRQLVATKQTLGMRKTDAMAERIRWVSDCALTLSNLFVTPKNAAEAIPEDVDFIVDAVDSLPGKLALIALAQARAIPIVSCMGAGNRLDPARFAITDVFSTQGDPLARRVRSELRKLGIPSLPVVFSHEAPHTAPGRRTVGSLAPVTASAGLCAAGYVLRRLMGEPG